MLIDTIFRRNFNYAPSGAAADAVDTEPVEDVEADDSDVGTAGETDDGSGESHESVEVPEPTLAQIKALAAEQGINDLADDPKQFVSSIAQLRKQAAEAQRDRDAMMWHFRQQQQQLSQQTAAPPKAKEPPKIPWSIPQFDRKLVAQLTKDAEGNIVARPGAMPTIPQDYAAWQEAREAAIDQFLQDPYSVMHGDAMREFVQEQARSVAQEMFQQHQSQAALNGYLQENRTWLFEDEGRSNTLSPAGQRIDAYIREAEAYGMDKASAIAHAEAKLDQELYRMGLERQATEKTAPKKLTPAEDRLAVLKKGAGHGNKNGSTKTKSPQNTDPEKVLARAREAAMQLSREDLLSN